MQLKEQIYFHRIWFTWVFNAAFNNISAYVYHGKQFYWWRKQEPEKSN